jgi:hypothetical protein
VIRAFQSFTTFLQPKQNIISMLHRQVLGGQQRLHHTTGDHKQTSYQLQCLWAAAELPKTCFTF